ncbi:MAG: YggS family pyridoxal phosphate-dependent enzyme [Deltaproteobacteria bacterium]|nr:MAG: YggS family pyridoxal phosphate-dependent enzyme [Deltaproteobacteria bacterium]
MSVYKNINNILEDIGESCLKAGRAPESVTLVAVSKTKSPELILEAYEAGQRHFGENYVQEALSKVENLPGDIKWHMIGHLQSNKAKYVAGRFALLHTVDRPSLADALNKQAVKLGITIPVLLQTNLAGESTKSGADSSGALAMAREADKWSGLEIRGLMCIPPFGMAAEESRPHFRALRDLSKKIGEECPNSVKMEELSMGMSHDYRVAIEEGATLVRVGSAIFGER